MAQGDFTKGKADAAIIAFEEIFKALRKTKQAKHKKSYDNIKLFLEDAWYAAPDKNGKEEN